MYPVQQSIVSFLVDLIDDPFTSLATRTVAESLLRELLADELEEGHWS